MSDQTCACPDCACGTSGDQAVERGGQRFCSDACADRHANGDTCPHKGCQCDQIGEVEGRPVTNSTLDDALEETFPASDPISP